MNRILTVTLNPAIDISYYIDDFQVDKLFRAKSNKTAGGKGLNVSRVLKSLGANVSATGFLGGTNGKWISNNIDSLGIENLFIETKNETRICMAILGKNTQTEILEPGPDILKNEIDLFLKNFKEILNDFDIICLSGSLPKNISSNFYKILCNLGKNKKIILDTSGNSMIEALKEHPFLIKPNKEELEDFFKVKINSIDEIIFYGKKLQTLGTKNVLISLGKDGAVYIGEKTYKIDIPKITVINPVGSGDSSVAGFAYGVSKNLSIEEVLKYSMACGMSNTMNSNTGFINLDQVNDLLKKIIVKEL